MLSVKWHLFSLGLNVLKPMLVKLDFCCKMASDLAAYEKPVMKIFVNQHGFQHGIFLKNAYSWYSCLLQIDLMY